VAGEDRRRELRRCAGDRRPAAGADQADRHGGAVDSHPGAAARAALRGRRRHAALPRHSPVPPVLPRRDFAQLRAARRQGGPPRGDGGRRHQLLRLRRRQATRFEGGVAVGVTVHHGVADGRALWTFVEAWAAACRGETPATTPCFDRSLVKLPGGEELARSVVRKVAPNLPSVAPPSSLVEDRKRFTRRTFTLDAGDIQRLKQRIVHLGDSHGAPLPHSPSTFTAVVALAWTCFARCKPFSPEDDAQLFFFADTRARLDPPVDVGYIGACLTGLISKLPVPELRGDRALPAAASAVEDEISKVKKDPIAGWNFLTLLTGACLDRMMNISGSSGFRAYEVADFGWGKPRRTEPITMNHDGQVALMRSRDGQGVQVSVSLLQPAHMDAFKSSFLELLKWVRS
uniref:Anthocyanin 5-aromatic acyltransferase n=1 Tax=Aegilops tauschii subsp. strangulata TaxID=200361 RepID=A0A453DA86_AEGTS